MIAPACYYACVMYSLLLDFLSLWNLVNLSELSRVSKSPRQSLQVFCASDQVFLVATNCQHIPVDETNQFSPEHDAAAKKDKSHSIFPLSLCEQR